MVVERGFVVGGRVMNFFRRKPKERVQLRVLHSTSMRLEQWQNSPELVDYAKRLFQTPQFLTMMDILRNESPASFGLALGSSHDDHVAHAYKGEGYNLALNNLEALATQVQQYDMPEATFAPEPRQPLPPDAPSFSLEHSKLKE